MTKMQFTNNDIIRYYELAEVHYRLFWNLEKSKSFHYGYWDDSTKNFHQALLNINKKLAELAAISKDTHVLDAGCGIGGSALWLASNIGCKVTGITLSERQVNKARISIGKASLESLVNFEQKDFSATGYPDQSFDIIWAIESVCYATDKKDFIKEAFRILKPGGKLIMADFFVKQGLQGEDIALVQKWTNGWAINEFATIEDFEKLLHRIGFKKIHMEDATKAILPSAKKLYRSYFLGFPVAWFYRLFRKPTTLSRNNVDAAYLQYKTLKKGFWKYMIVRAEKNHV